ncbi:hypothetical protein AYX15_00378 [Cryptococcus neoformans]|nr:hypothetical protein AYX15_00378 [Cryptococcus neoformans var. grubii]
MTHQRSSTASSLISQKSPPRKAEVAAIYVCSFDFHLYIPLPTGHLTRHAYIHSSIPLSRSHGCIPGPCPRRPSSSSQAAHLSSGPISNHHLQSRIMWAHQCVICRSYRPVRRHTLNLTPELGCLPGQKSYRPRQTRKKNQYLLTPMLYLQKLQPKSRPYLKLKIFPFIDGCIIGFPATEDFLSIPKLYFSASAERGNPMQEIAQTLNGEKRVRE